MLRILLIAGSLFALALPVHAHPVPKDTHDRHLTLTLRNGSTPDRLVLQLAYRLEADEFTIVFDDMTAFAEEADKSLLAKEPLKYYDRFTELFGDIFSANVLLKVNGERCKWSLKKRSCTLRDEKNEPLQHLRCDFLYEAELPPLIAGENTVDIVETNYREQEGQIFWSLANEAGVRITEQRIPPTDLNKVHPLERTGDYDKRLRSASIRFSAGQAESAQAKPNVPSEAPSSAEHDEGFRRLFRELRQNEVALPLLLLLFAGLGAAHALTPGHGKTLVAAYLVGEQGTILHAIVLGVVTTLTHTGVVLAIAAVLFFLPETMSGSAKHLLHTGLGLGMGLIVTCLGFWLLLQRLSGRADHVHIGGGHHHHHHGDHVHVHESPPEGEHRGLGWWGIVFLGMTGGLVPCWDAVMILITVVGTSELWFALPALLAFSAGLAGVLVAIGIAVVKFRNFAGSRWGNGRVVRALPLLSACLITAMGLWLCFESVRP